MTGNPDTDPTGADDRESPETHAGTRRWVHNHALFVLQVLIGGRWLKIYEHRKVHSIKIGEGVESWDAEDETLAIEEGRRQLDGQQSELQSVISRASVFLTVGIAASAFFLRAAGDLGDIAQPHQMVARILLLTGGALALWGALVMGALIGDKAPFEQTDAAQLTNEPAGLRKYLARDYAEMVPTGVDTNASRLTHLGTGVSWLAVAAVLGMVGLMISVLSSPETPCDDTPTGPEACLDSSQAPGEPGPAPTGSAEFGPPYTARAT